MINSGDLSLITEIKKRYGNVIDLEKSPMAIIEIIHNFRHLIDEVAGPDGTGGAGPGPKSPADVGLATVLSILLELKRDVQAINEKIKG